MWSRPRRRVLPGFGLSLGFTLSYVCLLVLLPLSGVVLKASGLTWDAFARAVTSERAVAAFGLSLGAALVAALVNAVFGLLVAWVLVRYRFPGRRLVDACVDLPFALPTSVAGIALTAVYSPNGWLGQQLAPLGIQVAFTRLGVIVALTFIGLPFVVRAVQPVLEDLDPEVEDASASLGATRWQTFRRVLLPSIAPALLTGFTLAFARALGEYGSVVFISGNLPLRTEVITLLIVARLEQFDYAGATAIASVMLGVSFVILLTINLLQAWTRRRGAVGMKAGGAGVPPRSRPPTEPCACAGSHRRGARVPPVLPVRAARRGVRAGVRGRCARIRTRAGRADGPGGAAADGRGGARRGADEHAVRRGRGVGDRALPLPGARAADHADRPAVRDLAGRRRAWCSC